MNIFSLCVDSNNAHIRTRKNIYEIYKLCRTKTSNIL